VEAAVIVPVMLIVYLPTWLAELDYHDTSLVVALNVIYDVNMTPVGGVTAIE
jgi:hypothetical protein